MSARSITQITGHTRVLGILADPIAHVKAPPGINAICERRGRDAVMVPFQVAPEHLAAFANSLRTLKSFDGAIITVPHKAAMVAHCDEVSARAQALGAVNVIRRTVDNRLHGDMLDGAGFIAGLLGAGVVLKGRRIYLAGAGGAASAIAFALAASGISHLTIANRTRAKAQDLCDRIAAAHQGKGTVEPVGYRQQGGAPIGRALGLCLDGGSFVMEGRQQMPAPLPAMDFGCPGSLIRPCPVRQGEDDARLFPMGKVAADISHDTQPFVAGDGGIVAAEQPIGLAVGIRDHPWIMDTQMGCQQRRLCRQGSSEHQQQQGKQAPHQPAIRLP